MKTKAISIIQKILSILCAVCIGFVTFLYTLSFPVVAASSDWSALGDDVVALYNSYVEYLNSASSSFSDLIKDGLDIPISWYKVLADGTKSISPVDDWYYYITDGDDFGGGGGRVHSGGSGGSGGRVRLADDVAPVLPAESIKQVSSYWAEYYKPMPTTTQYIWSYQSTGSESSSFINFTPYPPIYMDANGSWGKKNWSGVYFLLFYKDDAKGSYTFYNQYYYHIYSYKGDNDTLYYTVDKYDLTSGTLISSLSPVWNISSYPYLSLYFNSSQCYPIGFKGYDYYLSSNISGHLLPYISFGDFLGGKYLSGGSYSDLYNSSTLTPNTNEDDDFGFILSSEPFELFSNQTSVEFDKIPDNYYITIEGDNFYDYSITDPATGDTETINYYITNNYTLPDNGTKDDTSADSGSGSGSASGDVNVGGNVIVSGDVNVGGEIVIKSDPIDINVNINGGGSSGSGTSDSSGAAVEFDEDVSLNNYYDWMNDQTSGFSGFMQQFFSWLPPEIVIMLCAGFACVILMRVLGR